MATITKVNIRHILNLCRGSARPVGVIQRVCADPRLRSLRNGKARMNSLRIAGPIPVLPGADLHSARHLVSKYPTSRPDATQFRVPNMFSPCRRRRWRRIAKHPAHSLLGASCEYDGGRARRRGPIHARKLAAGPCSSRSPPMHRSRHQGRGGWGLGHGRESNSKANEGARHRALSGKASLGCVHFAAGSRAVYLRGNDPNGTEPIVLSPPGESRTHHHLCYHATGMPGAQRFTLWPMRRHKEATIMGSGMKSISTPTVHQCMPASPPARTSTSSLGHQPAPRRRPSTTASRASDRLHGSACTAPTRLLAAVLPVNSSTHGRRRRVFIQTLVHRLRLLLLRLSVSVAPQYPTGRQLRLTRARWTMHLLLRRFRRPTAARRNTRRMVRTVSRGRSCVMRRDVLDNSLLAFDGVKSSPRSTGRVTMRGYGSGAWGWKTASRRRS